MSVPLKILTIDLEDWFHILDNDTTMNETTWVQYPRRIEQMTLRLLDLFDLVNVKATFFILGYIAKTTPEIVQEISNRGHEIASHGQNHQLVYSQTQKEFQSDLNSSKESIFKACGIIPTAYRAPGFSITSQNLWAFEILRNEGFNVDCSVFPARRAHGGIPQFPDNEPCILLHKNHEPSYLLPISTTKLWRANIVVSGGGYFRLAPWFLIAEIAKSSDYFMTYFHPRDFDADQPMIQGLGVLRRFKSYVGLKKAFGKLEALVTTCPFITVGEALTHIEWNRQPVLEIVGNEMKRVNR